MQGEDSECLTNLAKYLSDEFQNKRDEKVGRELTILLLLTSRVAPLEWIQILMETFLIVLLQRLDILEWPKVYHKNIPQQQNGVDCGVFLVLFANYVVRYCFLYLVDSRLYNLTTYSVITMQSMAAKLNFTQGDIDDFRIKIALDFAEMEVQ